ncbi:hypothetical protein NMY22_g2481 [Coprinellus aureogranulatus]|nr:hypothetical protein NMY22_g2481 [Coprinellus aureogranulatus]
MIGIILEAPMPKATRMQGPSRLTELFIRHASSAVYTSTGALLIESSVLYSMFLLASMIPFALGDPVANFPGDVRSGPGSDGSLNWKAPVRIGSQFDGIAPQRSASATCSPFFQTIISAMDRLPALPHLLRSNDPPLASEVPVIESIVGLMDDNVEALKAQLANVIVKRQQYQALLSPLRRMPLDILGEIFSHILGSGEQSLQKVVSLCLVCKAWRDAAYATHRLWSHIEIDTSRAPNEWKRVERWISRSGATPKSLSVNAAKDTCRGPSTGTRTGRTKSSRPWDGIKSLSLTVRDVWSEGPTGDEVPRDLPGDRTYDAGAYRSFFKGLPPVSLFHLNTPAYHSLAQSHLPKFPHISAPPSFLSHLTTLSIYNDWGGSALVRLLHSCHQSNLEELIFGCKSEFVEYDDTDTYSRESICTKLEKMFTLPKLRTLRFRSLHRDAFWIALYFKAPSLSELELGFDDRGPSNLPSNEQNLWTIDCENMSGHVPWFIELSGCQESLQRLIIHGNLKLEMDDLQTWLGKKLTPSLSHLTFDGVYLPVEFFGCLRDSHPTIPLDHVKTIEILNVPPELHFLGRYHRDVRETAKGKHSYLPDTNLVITLRSKED